MCRCRDGLIQHVFVRGFWFLGGKWHLEDKESCSCPKPPRSLAVVVAAAAEAVRNSLMALLLRS